MTPRHKVFVSYHHANDQVYKELFEQWFGQYTEAIVPGSVKDGDIDESLSADRIRQIIRDKYLRDTTVTVVLIGTQTWQRKHVDWEIGSSIRKTQYNPRSGLLGVFLPTHRGNSINYDKFTIPPRLYDNVRCGYALLIDWTNDPNRMKEVIHRAYLNRDREDLLPDNSRDSFAQNRSGVGWSY